MKMNELSRLTGSALKNSRRVAAVVVTGLALAAGSSAQAGVVTFSGTLDPAGPFGHDLLAYDFTAGNYIFTVVGSPVLSLFTAAYAPISPITSGAPGITAYTFANLTAGSYLVSLFGAANVPYTLVMAGTGAVTPTAVPEPESLALALAGLGSAGILMRRRRNDNN